MTRDPLSSPPRSRPLRAIMIATALAFLGGLAVMGWAFTHWKPAQKWVETPPLEPAASNNAAPQAPAAAIPAPAPGASVTDEHVAQLESRLAVIDTHAAAAADQASRAEGMLIAFAARRAVDRGVVLGYLEGQLSAHFGAAQPRAVANIIAASHTPVTLDTLRAGLDGVTPEADPASGPKADWWTRLRSNLSGLITVRKAGQASVAPPDERMARARLALSTGAVENALAEIARLPGGPSTNAWMANARRYIEAHSALDVLEASALMKPEAAKPIIPAPPPNPTPSTPPASQPSNTAGSI